MDGSPHTCLNARVRLSDICPLTQRAEIVASLAPYGAKGYSATYCESRSGNIRMDARFQNDDSLFRRIHLVHLVTDEGHRSCPHLIRRFQRSRDVGQHRVRAPEIGTTREACLANYPGQRLAVLQAGVVRGLHQTICLDPLPSDPSHGLVYSHKTGRISDALRRAATWAIPQSPPLWKDIEEEKRGSHARAGPSQAGSRAPQQFGVYPNKHLVVCRHLKKAAEAAHEC